MLVERIRALSLEARKNRSATSGALSALLGEISTAQKAPGRDPNAPLNDTEAIAIVKRFLKNNAEALAPLEGLGGEAVEAARAKLIAERELYESLLPKQMTAEEIEAFARERKDKGIGGIMAALKAERAGLYDGKLASEIAKRVIQEG